MTHVEPAVGFLVPGLELVHGFDVLLGRLGFLDGDTVLKHPFGDLRRAGGRLFGCRFVLGRARLKFVELELHLVEKALLALRTLAVERSPELLDHQLHGGDLRFGVGHLRLGVCSPRLGLGRFGLRRRQRGPRRVDVRSVRHAWKRITTSGPPLRQSCPMSHFAAGQPARDGRHVRTGLRQSIPSSR